jgi:hypothetical protein
LPGDEKQAFASAAAVGSDSDRTRPPATTKMDRAIAAVGRITDQHEETGAEEGSAMKEKAVRENWIPMRPTRCQSKERKLPLGDAIYRSPRPHAPFASAAPCTRLPPTPPSCLMSYHLCPPPLAHYPSFSRRCNGRCVAVSESARPLSGGDCRLSRARKKAEDGEDLAARRCSLERRERTFV